MKTKDKAFLERLYSEYYSPMLGYANSFLKCPSLAHDVVHNVFVKLIRNLETLRSLEKSKVPSYVSVAVKHAAYDMLEKEKRFNHHSEKEVSNGVIEVLMEDKLFAVCESQSVVKSLVMNLPEKYQDIIMMLYSIGLSPKEAADTMNISIANLYVRKSRALKLLRMYIENNETHNEVDLILK